MSKAQVAGNRKADVGASTPVNFSNITGRHSYKPAAIYRDGLLCASRPQPAVRRHIHLSLHELRSVITRGIGIGTDFAFTNRRSRFAGARNTARLRIGPGY